MIIIRNRSSIINTFRFSYFYYIRMMLMCFFIEDL